MAMKGGEAELDSEVLIDDLVVDLDELKGELYADLGMRAFDVQVVVRTWTGETIGDGEASDQFLTLQPPPEVRSFDGYRWVLLAQGYNASGEIRITDVSLAYTYEQLTGCPAGESLGQNQQLFYRLVEAHGQGQEERLLRLKAPPAVDRAENMCWEIRCVNANAPDDAGVLEDP